MLYPKWSLYLAPALVVVHLNYWMWDDASIVLGLPVNLLYHVAFSVSLTIVMVVLVRRGWPGYLDQD